MFSKNYIVNWNNIKLNVRFYDKYNTALLYRHKSLLNSIVLRIFYVTLLRRESLINNRFIMAIKYVSIRKYYNQYSAHER